MIRKMKISAMILPLFIFFMLFTLSCFESNKVTSYNYYINTCKKILEQGDEQFKQLNEFIRKNNYNTSLIVEELTDINDSLSEKEIDMFSDIDDESSDINDDYSKFIKSDDTDNIPSNIKKYITEERNNNKIHNNSQIINKVKDMQKDFKKLYDEINNIDIVIYNQSVSKMKEIQLNMYKDIISELDKVIKNTDRIYIFIDIYNNIINRTTLEYSDTVDKYLAKYELNTEDNEDDEDDENKGGKDV